MGVSRDPGITLALYTIHGIRMKGSIILALCVALAWAHEGDEGRQKRLYPTRCYPGSHCFPDQEEIEIFKDSLDGSVVVPSDPDYPSRVASTNLRWTRNPAIVVIAGSVGDVQKTVLFARHYYLNLVYSASGVDYTGKGMYDGSLRLDLSLLKTITTSDLSQFNIAGTVTAQAGVTWGEIYAQIESAGFPRAISGGSQSLDTVDTFTMTGGLGPLSRTLGLAADQLISAQVVLANGNLATVSSAGVTVTNLIVDDGQVVGRATLRSILQNVASLTFQWGGYVSIDGAPDAQFANDRGQMRFHLFSYGRYDFTFNQQNNIFTAVENLRNIVNRNGANPTTNTISSLSQYRTDVAEVEQHFTNKPNTYVFNTLLNADVISNSTKLDLLVDLMMETVNSPTASSNWRCVGKLAGGKVSSPNTETYVNPKLREALFSWTCALTWDDGVTREDYYIAQALVSR